MNMMKKALLPAIAIVAMYSSLSAYADCTFAAGYSANTIETISFGNIVVPPAYSRGHRGGDENIVGVSHSRGYFITDVVPPSNSMTGVHPACRPWPMAVKRCISQACQVMPCALSRRARVQPQVILEVAPLIASSRITSVTGLAAPGNIVAGPGDRSRSSW